MDPPSRERRYELVSGGAAERALRFALRLHLKMTWQEWRTAPWNEQAEILEGLIRAELFNPDDYESGPDELDDLAAKGFDVGTQ